MAKMPTPLAEDMRRLSDLDQQIYVLKAKRWDHAWLISHPSQCSQGNIEHHKAEVVRLDAEISALVAAYDRIVENSYSTSDTDEDENGHR